MAGGERRQSRGLAWLGERSLVDKGIIAYVRHLMNHHRHHEKILIPQADHRQWTDVSRAGGTKYSSRGMAIVDSA